MNTRMSKSVWRGLGYIRVAAMMEIETPEDYDHFYCSGKTKTERGDGTIEFGDPCGKCEACLALADAERALEWLTDFLNKLDAKYRK